MEIVNINGRDIEVKPLTRGQVRELKEHGFTYFTCRPTIEQANDAMDAAFKLVLSDDDRLFLDDQYIKDSIAVWKAIINETYGGGEDEGNSKGTSGGGSTESA